MFEYNTPQVLKDGNDNYNNGEVTYEYLVFEISETDDMIFAKMLYSKYRCNIKLCQLQKLL